ncbi:invasin domain 3-containing protein [Serratia symbiotica]|uniref:invasin domain 3-containing protein n=1 Tax=Serratia symbiotica TaxID=138074 RepID=UPI001CF07D85|nr:invasin domain 3-containing protein [Serratia symbiotica]
MDGTDTAGSGGKIVQVGVDYSVVLPPYQKVGREINTYLLSGVAVDTRGNRTERSEIRVTVLAPVITESHAAQENSAITRDQDSYVAGREMMVTVTLKDAQGNPVSGQASALTNDRVQVAHATAKATAWKDAGNGIYTRTYTAQQVGTNLKARLQLNDWRGANSSPAYTIGAGAATQANSAITRDRDSYLADDEMMVTVTLKDAQGNPVSGQASALTNDSVQVAHATAKATAWTDVGNGIYTRTYTAQQVGTNLKARLQLNDWRGANSSPAYTIGAGAATQANSAITRDRDSYLADDEMMVTVTLKDAQGNPVIGQASALTDDRVQVANAAAKATAWTDAGNGIYTRTYTAQQAGSALKATLKLPDWNSADESATYAISAGEATQANSAITRDQDSYLAGSEMMLTVTLKDAQGNPISGQASALTNDRVQVANAAAKATAWTDAGNGTYTRTYTAQQAGSALKATLKLPDWNSADESAAYTISAGEATQANSAITRDRDSYLADDEMMVTVTLKDAQGNPVIGQASALTDDRVQVANAAAKATAWTDAGNGIYTRTYTAQQAGSALKATLKLPDWNSADESATYAISAGEATQANSAITRDQDSYVAGSEMMLTVTLKDAQGNPVSGQASALTNDRVQVANAAAKATAWTDAGNGTYTRTYTAQQAGSALKATLKLPDWNSADESATYAISAGEATQANSAITRDQDSYVAGSEMMLTVTLKDAQGNPVSGQASALTNDRVQVANAAAKATAWTDAGNGTYTRTYTAQQAGSALKATLKLPDWNSADESAAYTISAGEAAQANSAIARDQDSYLAGSEMVLTVTLKDAQGNPVIGQASALTDDSVQVAHATAKATAWTDAGNGIYTRTYTAQQAGSALKATLKLPDWNSADESATYAISAGEATQANSAITRDQDSYLAGSEMMVTVTLKDAQGNPISGQASALTNDRVQVANAAAKATAWTDAGNGTYTRTYTAQQAGSALKATLKLPDWNSADESAAYTISAGEAAQANSAIARDQDSYLAGSEMVLTVTLKDAQGNPVIGQASALTDDSVQVAHATAKATAWTDAGNGTYTRTYTAQQAGSALKATLKLPDWNSADESAAYTISAGEATQANSAITRDRDSYLADDEMMVTVTLKDAQGNPVIGQASALTDDSVQVAHATAKATAWTDAGNGIYTRTYTAQQAGSALKATLKLPDWNSADESATYAISAGEATQANSAITRDQDSYVAGSEMMLTVTLKDAQGNPVSGQASALTNDRVQVANAAAKATAWTDAGNGTYTRTYTAQQAGSALKATLKLPDWNSADESAAYTISAGEAAQANSAIARDQDSYLAGSEMVLTVTLKDAQGNPVIGQASALTDDSVQVAHATAKATAWTDAGNGIYTRTYTAQQAGSALKATLKLPDWNSADESATYAISAGEATQANSAITRDQDSYLAGSEMMLTVTLKDAQGNPVSGQSAALTDDRVQVANAAAKATAWTDAGNGIYTRTYTAQQAGSALKATLKLPDWNSADESAAYTISAGEATQANSAITRDQDSYLTDDEMMLTVTLKDAQGNPVIGQASALTDDRVQVANAAAKAEAWTDAGNGIYTRTYTAQQAGSALKATLQLPDWNSADESATYVITKPDELRYVNVNNYNFAKDAGFPTTGFKGAKFVLTMDRGSASDYTWSSNTDWVSVDNGVVIFRDWGTKDKVTITITPKNGGRDITYAFTLNSWFINDSDNQLNWSDANQYCRKQNGNYSLATTKQLAGGIYGERENKRGRIGNLWSEWGDMGTYRNSGFVSNYYWTPEPDKTNGSDDTYYNVSLYKGYTISNSSNYSRYVACWHGF